MAGSVLSKLSSWLPLPGGSFALRPAPPSLGVEISPRRVSVVRVRRERRGARCSGYGIATLPEGAIQTALMKCSVSQPAEVLAALRRALDGAGARPGRAALTLPDIAGRVTLLSVPELPRSRSQAEELIRFRMKRSLPFRPEEVAVSFARLSGGEPAGAEGTGGQVLAVLAMRSVLDQHERVLAEAGLRVGLVSLATLDLANLCRMDLARIALEEAGEVGTADAALLNCEPEYCTLALFRGGRIVFFRCKSHVEGEDGNGSVRLKNLRRELSTSLSYYSERLSGRFPLPVLYRNMDPLAEGLEELLPEVGLSPARSIDVSARVSLSAEAAASHGPKLAHALGATAGRMR